MPVQFKTLKGLNATHIRTGFFGWKTACWLWDGYAFYIPLVYWSMNHFCIILRWLWSKICRSNLFSLHVFFFILFFLGSDSLLVSISLCVRASNIAWLPLAFRLIRLMWLHTIYENTKQIRWDHGWFFFVQMYGQSCRYRSNEFPCRNMYSILHFQNFFIFLFILLFAMDLKAYVNS